MTKPELTKDLNDILRGSTRTPALLFGQGELTVESLNLENYEVLYTYFEALHCSMNQIKNVLEELPHHISDIDTLTKLKEILAVQLNKEKMRGVDYRKTLIFLTIALHQTATRDVRILLMTLCEMVETFYCQEKRRSPRLVLRLHNLCWRHAIQCRRVLTPTRALTSRKLFGLYFHACVSHSAFLLCQSLTDQQMQKCLRDSLRRLKTLPAMQFSICKQRNQHMEMLWWNKRKR